MCCLRVQELWDQLRDLLSIHVWCDEVITLAFCHFRCLHSINVKTPKHFFHSRYRFQKKIQFLGSQKAVAVWTDGRDGKKKRNRFHPKTLPCEQGLSFLLQVPDLPTQQTCLMLWQANQQIHTDWNKNPLPSCVGTAVSTWRQAGPLPLLAVLWGVF